MTKEAQLVEGIAGLTPAERGWFTVNVARAAWFTGDKFGAVGILEGQDYRFQEIGINLRVLNPGQPASLYHAEEAEEDFLVLTGACTLLIEGEERSLRAWDFVHCPPETAHVFIGAGEGPCAILMVGARKERAGIRYPLADLARKLGVGVKAETSSPAEAYAGFARRTPGRPAEWSQLPWASSD